MVLFSEAILKIVENYLKILACSQESDRCPLGYLLQDTVPSSNFHHV